ncbi:MAG TPA: DUF192 domain-containing protein [Candidatus Polarisedimenticolaceae bacterium]
MIAAWLLAAAVVAPRFAVAVLPNGTEFALEVAADPESRARGYMFRESVGPKEGMVFVFDSPERQGMWMKNCRVPLDLVWLDGARRVVHVAENQRPCPSQGPCPVVESMRPALYVLEFAGGTARREGLRIGDTIALLSDPPLR